jgi:hypothetical protein
MDCRHLDKHTLSKLWRSVVEIIPSYSMGYCYTTFETESIAAYLVLYQDRFWQLIYRL